MEVIASGNPGIGDGIEDLATIVALSGFNEVAAIVNPLDQGNRKAVRV